ncbi:MAG: hypothetical protein U0795_17325 [Pirellulales bacterium]
MKLSNSIRILPLIAVALSLTVPLNCARAELLAYESFDYTAGTDVVFKNGGTGFGNAWLQGGFNASLSNNFDVGSGSLTFGNLSNAGNHAVTDSTGAIAGLTRLLGQSLGTADSTRYVSFLLRPEVALNQGAFNGFFGLVLEQSGEPELFIGKPGGGQLNRYVMEDRGGTNQVATSVSPVVGQTTLLVLKAEFKAGNDLFTLYADPIPGLPEPASGVIKSTTDVGQAFGLTIYSTGAFSIDEIRVGETFADVTPVPEPLAQSALMLLTLTAIWRRRPSRASISSSDTDPMTR